MGCVVFLKNNGFYYILFIKFVVRYSSFNIPIKIGIFKILFLVVFRKNVCESRLVCYYYIVVNITRFAVYNHVSTLNILILISKGFLLSTILMELLHRKLRTIKLVIYV